MLPPQTAESTFLSLPTPTSYRCPVEKKSHNNTTVMTLPLTDHYQVEQWPPLPHQVGPLGQHLARSVALVTHYWPSACSVLGGALGQVPPEHKFPNFLGS